MADDYEALHPGRRVVATYPSPSHVCETCSSPTWHRVSILDAPVEFDVAAPVAAMVVPLGSEARWEFGTAGGQWQLTGSAGVSRLVLMERAARCGICCSSSSSSDSWVSEDVRDAGALPRRDDETRFRNQMENLVKALAPLSCYTGPFSVPFVNFTDDVVGYVKLEEVESPLTGTIVVEDVELGSWSEEGEGEGLGMEERNASAESSLYAHKNVERVFRRRMRFKRMPNLIQSEVPLWIRPKISLQHGSRDSTADSHRLAVSCNGDPAMSKEKTNWGGFPENFQLSEVERIPDYTSLVHKYLAPMLSGLFLISPYLNFSMLEEHRIQVLVIGGGACTLPIFLRLHFPFHIQVIELDKTVISLAERHFGLVQDEKLKITIANGLEYIRALQPSNCKKPFCQVGASPQLDHLEFPSTPHGSATSPHINELNIKISVLMIDVDVEDGRLSLSAPPMEFLEKEFLTMAKSAMQPEGVLIMNVVPWGKSSLNYAISALKEVFVEVYQCLVEGDVNCVLYALCKPLGKTRLSSNVGNVVLPHSLRYIAKV